MSGVEPFETAEGSEYPFCRQLSVFLENRVGQLSRLTRLLDASEARIMALSVEGSIDCAIVRLLVDDADGARRMISDAGFAVSESEVVVVDVPPGKRGILAICQALLSGEVNIHYTYPLLSSKNENGTLAIQVDDRSLAARLLAGRKFRVLDQSDL